MLCHRLLGQTTNQMAARPELSELCAAPPELQSTRVLYHHPHRTAIMGPSTGSNPVTTGTHVQPCTRPPWLQRRVLGQSAEGHHGAGHHGFGHEQGEHMTGLENMHHRGHLGNELQIRALVSSERWAVLQMTVRIGDVQPQDSLPLRMSSMQRDGLP